MKKKRPFLSSDKLFGLTAMLISLVTLIIFVRQTNIIDKQSKLSVLPYLTIESSRNGAKHMYSLSLMNQGVGPAIIDNIQINYMGKEYKKDFYSFFTEHVQEMDSIEVINWTTIRRGMPIPAGDKVVMLAVGANQVEYDKFLEIAESLNEDLDYKIEYHSIYGDRWKLSSDSEIPEQLD